MFSKVVRFKDICAVIYGAEFRSFAVKGGVLSRDASALRQTLTLDNDSEMTGFKKLEKATGLTVYFADSNAA